jgi:hypothetical protein
LSELPHLSLPWTDTYSPAAIDIAPAVLVHRCLRSLVFGIASRKLVVQNDVEK